MFSNLQKSAYDWNCKEPTWVSNSFFQFPVPHMGTIFGPTSFILTNKNNVFHWFWRLTINNAENRCWQGYIGGSIKPLRQCWHYLNHFGNGHSRRSHNRAHPKASSYVETRTFMKLSICSPGAVAQDLPANGHSTHRSLLDLYASKLTANRFLNSERQ